MMIALGKFQSLTLRSTERLFVAVTPRKAPEMPPATKKLHFRFDPK
jgi:hypothetical protein